LPIARSSHTGTDASSLPAPTGTPSASAAANPSGDWRPKKSSGCRCSYTVVLFFLWEGPTAPHGALTRKGLVIVTSSIAAAGEFIATEIAWNGSASEKWISDKLASAEIGRASCRERGEVPGV